MQSLHGRRLWLSTFMKNLNSSNVPCVLVSWRINWDFESCTVSTDDMAAAEVAVDYLFDHRHDNMLLCGEISSSINIVKQSEAQLYKTWL